MSAFNTLLKTLSSRNPLAGFGAQARGKFLPYDEQTILDNIRKNAPEILKRGEGFTFDPRRGVFLEPEKQLGSMMSSIPNDPSLLPVQAGAGVARNVQDLINISSKPEIMARLRRNEYLGGWGPNGELGLDPSKRFLTDASAIRSGLKTGQAAGFRTGRGQTYDVNEKQKLIADAKLFGTAALGSYAGGTIAGDYLSDKELDTTKEIAVKLAEPLLLAGLGGSLFKAARNPGAVYSIGAPSLKKLEKAGIPKGDFAYEGTALLKDTAKKLRVKNKELKKISDNLTEEESAPLIYDLVYDNLKSRWKGLTRNELIEQKNLIKQKGNLIGKPIKIDTLITNIRSKPFKGTKVKFEQSEGYTVSPEYAEYGITEVRHAKNLSELTKLYKSGQIDKFAEAVEDITNNILRSVNEQDLIDIKRRKNIPEFYSIANLYGRAKASQLGLSQLDFLMGQAPYSKAKPPVFESTQHLGSIAEPILKRKGFKSQRYPSIFNISEAKKKYKKLHNLKKNPTEKELVQYLDENELELFNKQKAAVKLQEKTKNEGKLLINTSVAAPKEVGTNQQFLKKLKESEDGIIKFIENPLNNGYGIREKVYAYMGSYISPRQNVASVQDSWMIRTAFGDSSLSTAKAKGKYLGEYSLIHDIFNNIAKQLGVNKSALQEAVWRNSRIMASKDKVDPAFLELNAPQFEFPNIAISAINKNKIPANLPKVSSFKNEPEIIKRRDDFINNLLKAVKKNPDAAKYFRIVGDDIEFTDEFFNAIDTFDTSI